MKANELRIGNLVNYNEGGIFKVIGIYEFGLDVEDNIEATYMEYENFHPISLTEERLLKFGFSIINENSAGKEYGYVIDGVYSSALTFIHWKTTKNAGKFFRGDLQLKYVHQLQNLYFALTGQELEVER